MAKNLFAFMEKTETPKQSSSNPGLHQKMNTIFHQRMKTIIAILSNGDVHDFLGNIYRSGA